MSKLFIQRQKVENSSSFMSLEKKNERLDQLDIVRVIDTNRNTYGIEIVPIGEFSFSATEGFKGNANTIKWNGTSSNMQHLLATKQIAQTNEHTEKQTETKKNSESKNIRKKEKVKFQLIWIIVSIAALFLIVRKLKKWRNYLGDWSLKSRSNMFML